MPDAFGDRAVFSVVLPVTNAVVEPDMAGVRPPGVTNQTFRFPFPGLPDTVGALTEARHDKPVIAVNSATYWLALREHGITDRLDSHHPAQSPAECDPDPWRAGVKSA
jgi:maleate cis-trans isomerase